MPQSACKNSTPVHTLPELLEIPAGALELDHLTIADLPQLLEDCHIAAGTKLRFRAPILPKVPQVRIFRAASTNLRESCTALSPAPTFPASDASFGSRVVPINTYF